ncbi:GIY-YIG nuclease family protein [Thiothrix unzii]|uniref:GIY-YIG nuclease family protein n=2 Tax=Thiothrix TaxID=1030 RepID=A0A975F654_9GAMM|nr:GIY-YIG nuclease family protein [Thiothrix unzii]QTR52150.1 GIY-YIG nuclease family protein [Thiothrix unzii]
MADNTSQIVYVLTNPAMPGLVKIGKTTQLEVSERMKQLYSTGVPVPFDCAFACQVKDASEVEKALHFAFGRDRTNPNREFFSIEAERVIAVLKLLKVDDITTQFEQQIEADVEAVDKQSAQHLKEARRPRMNFQELNIPAGSILVFKDGQAQVTVLDERKVNLNGVICSLTAATRKVLGLADNYPLQPSPYWTFNGKTVKEIYEAYHSTAEDA